MFSPQLLRCEGDSCEQYVSKLFFLYNKLFMHVTKTLLSFLSNSFSLQSLHIDIILVTFLFPVPFHFY